MRTDDLKAELKSAAALLGRAGGKKGGKAKSEKKAIAARANAAARWAKRKATK